MVPHDTPPRGTVEAVIKEEKKRILLAGFSDNAGEVRKRTQINNLLHVKANCCVPSSQARH